jgi:hypothetical protein
MTTLPLNGVRLRVRLVEVEVSRLKLDPENPRLHSAYLETEKKQGRCESDPAFLLMAAVRTAGCFGYSNPWVWKT